MLEDMQRNATQMEKEVKMMLEMEGRAYGIELDRRKNARTLMEELAAHMESSQANDASMTWAYVPDDTCTYDCSMPDTYMPYEPYYPDDTMALPTDVNWNMNEYHDPAMMDHTHDDGTSHAHEGGDMPHTHDEQQP